MDTSSPGTCVNNTTVEKGLTLLSGTGMTWQIATGDLLYINKPLAQAGLGVGNVRVSTTNSAGVTFSNFTAATITITATSSFGIVAIRGLPVLSPVLSPAVLAANSVVEQTFACTGLSAGELVQVSKPTSQAGMDIVGCRVVSDNVLGITFANVTAATILPTASETYTVLGLRGLDAVSNTILVEANVGTLSACNAGLAAEQGITLTGLATTDAVIGVTKPTCQVSVGIIGWRVSAANSLGITFGNISATTTVTPTGSEVYGVAIHRPKPVAPLVLYNVSLAPTSVAANTTAEQTFTVTGLVASSAVWVNKPSWTSGLGISGVRVSAADTLAVTYCNGTSAAITPPTETYIIGNFQQPIPDAGNEWIFSVNPTAQTTSRLSNNIRSALVNLGLMAGA